MDNNPIDPAVFDPSLVFPTDTMLQSGQQVPGGGGSGTMQPQIIPAPSGGSPGGALQGVVSSIGGDILSAIPGVSSIIALIKVVEDVVIDIEKGVRTATNAHPLSIVTEALKHIDKAPNIFTLGVKDFWEWVTSVTVGEFFKSYLTAGLEIDTDKFTLEEKKAITTIDTMLGFTAVLQFAVAALDFAGEGVFANRWGKALKDTVAKIPEEMGLSWAMGLTIEESFKAAQGTILTEAINKQKHPNRLQWPQIRLLLKQHVITPQQFNDSLLAAGFDANAIDWLDKLIDQQVPIGDIAQLWYRNVIDDKTAKQMIIDLGFSATAADQLYDLYLAKAETQASSTYRTIAKSLFTNHLIAEDQYRTILTDSNFPSKMVEQDITAIKLEWKAGRLLHDVGEIKTRYLHNAIDPKEATTELQQLNYSPTFITELLQSWDEGPIKRKHGISAAKTLSYLISGVIGPDTASKWLSSTGLTDDAVAFLIAHPTASPGVKQHKLTPGLVMTAYTDGVITQDQLDAAFKSAGVAPENISYYEAVAKYRLAHKRGAPGADIPLTAAEFKEGYKYGLVDFHGLVTALESLGYSADNALFIAEIANKGPQQAVTPPAFANIQAAIAYMIAAGYEVFAPTDPTLLAAENMLAVAGYSWQQGAGGHGTAH
jgi:hypothetical protein